MTSNGWRVVKADKKIGRHVIAELLGTIVTIRADLPGHGRVVVRIKDTSKDKIDRVSCLLAALCEELADGGTCERIPDVATLPREA